MSDIFDWVCGHRVELFVGWLVSSVVVGLIFGHVLYRRHD